MDTGTLAVTASRRALLLGGPALLLAGCVVATRNPYPPPPAPQVEVVPAPPPHHEHMVWEPGHWHWNGTTYAWVPGRYVERVASGTRWVGGQWAQRGGAWVWVPAHWE